MNTPTPEDIEAVAADPKLYFCWYSKNQLHTVLENQVLANAGARHQANMYRSPDGTEFLISEVTKSPQYGSHFEDVEYLGIGRYEKKVDYGIPSWDLKDYGIK
jgi:hypothetical protein